MEYSLAKQLKDAGFPFDDAAGRAMEFTDSMPRPTLSELIEACGERFQSLTLVYHSSRTDLWWKARSRQRKSTSVSREGKTPLEAVARLWLALHPVKV